MSKREENPAFPTFGPRENSGMSLRDYFAGQALVGIASQYHEQWAPDRVGPVCYELADALIAERTK